MTFKCSQKGFVLSVKSTKLMCVKAVISDWQL